jgi:arylsulfatase A-like enzyme
VTRIGRRRVLGLLAGAAASAMLPGPTRAAPTKPRRKPNVLVIQPDQHRGMTLGAAGDKQARTPMLDALASEGTRFSHAVSSSPLCAPFRATMQSGLRWFSSGVSMNYRRLPVRLTTFAEVFRQHGYDTGYMGKWHLDGQNLPGSGGFVPPGPRRQGWDDWKGYEKGHSFFNVWQFDARGAKVPVEGYDWEPTWQTDVMLDFARGRVEPERPWLYYLSYGPPHKPEECPQRFLDLFPPDGFTLPPDLAGAFDKPDEERVRNLYQMYYGQVAAVDHEVGRVVAGLDALGIAEDTIIVYCSDHGDRLGSHSKRNDGTVGLLRGKGAPFATALQIPLIVRAPGRVRGGQVTSALVGSEDLAPTILELAGLEPPDSMQGQSVARWCTEGAGPERDAVYLGLGMGRDPGQWRGLWDGRHVYSRGAYKVLYDHEPDPYEMHNLRGDTSHKALEQKLSKRLLALAKEVGDPLLPHLVDGRMS